MALISVVTPCYNEEENVDEVYRQVKEALATTGHRREHIFIDNASTDRTVEILRRLATADPDVKVILNARNFGHIRSPYHGLLQARGDAVALVVADLQDPPLLLREFIAKWEAGYKVVIGVKPRSLESPVMFALRKLYYGLSRRISNVELISNFTGFGLYDRRVIETLREIGDPYPYFRGLLCEIGFEMARIPYVQPARRRGITKNNFYSLFDMAMLGITSHSKVPLRLATMAGFGLSVASLLVSLGYLVTKLVFWDSFALGMAPLLIGLFFFASVQLFFIGLLGEYIGAVHTHVRRLPLVVERERINWVDPPSAATAAGGSART